MVTAATVLFYFQYYAFAFFDKVMLILGPVLVCLATSLISLVVYTFFWFALPDLVGYDNVHGLYWWIHACLGSFLLFNIVFNYFNCVRTNPGNTKSALYMRLLREAKAAGNFNCSNQMNTQESDADDDDSYDASGPLLEKSAATSKRRGPPISPSMLKEHLKAGNDDTGSIKAETMDNFEAQAVQNKSKSWFELGDNEWSVCKNSGKLKPPRAHYDHVTKSLVMNMDHYCPWMANVVGYGNYRYFFLFLLYMFTGSVYAACVSGVPFLYHRHDYRDSIALARYHQVHSSPDQSQNPISMLRGRHKDPLLNMGKDARRRRLGVHWGPGPELGHTLGGALVRASLDVNTNVWQQEVYLSAAAAEAAAEAAGVAKTAGGDTPAEALAKRARRLKSVLRPNPGNKKSASELHDKRVEQIHQLQEVGRLRAEGNWYIMFTFILTLSVSIAVFLLLAWHVYLTLTAQTTIEFHGNRTKASRLKSKGILYHNPYDLGCRKNWEQIFGPGHPVIAIMPSTRPPPWPPWPQHKVAVQSAPFSVERTSALKL